MDNRKIKNLIIYILLAVNAVLAFLVYKDMQDVKNARIAEANSIIEIMANNGIELSYDVAILDSDISVIGVYRDLDTETKYLEKALGDLSMSDQGGNMYYYENESGMAVYYGSGTFNILINSGALDKSSDYEKVAVDFCESLGMEIATSYVKDSTVTMYAEVEGVEVLNCEIEANFVNGELFLVTGTRVMAVSKDTDTTEVLSFSTILMKFLQIVKDGGYVCSELVSAELCYVQTVSASGSGSLIPVWKLTTDAGDFYINCITGMQQSLA